MTKVSDSVRSEADEYRQGAVAVLRGAKERRIAPYDLQLIYAHLQQAAKKG